MESQRYELLSSGATVSMISSIALGAVGGFYFAYLARDVWGARSQARTMTFVTAVMISVCVTYGVLYGVIVGAKYTPPDYQNADYILGYVGYSSGLVVGLTNGLTAMALGIFGSKAVRAIDKQPRCLIGAVLITIYIEAVALYSLIWGIASMNYAQIAQADLAAEDWKDFAFGPFAAFVGSIAGSTYCSVAIMEVAQEKPSMMMRALMPIVFNGVTAIYGLIGGMVVIVHWPQVVSTYCSGLCYLVSSALLGHFGYTGVMAMGASEQSNRQFIQMVMKLIGSQAVGLAGLMICLFAVGSETIEPGSVRDTRHGYFGNGGSSYASQLAGMPHGHLIICVAGVALIGLLTPLAVGFSRMRQRAVLQESLLE
eukprot:TRINITY_DN3639_c0_g3_i1.p1 TRINITY_DN3639_c0_g3~~TRINITY_DN3639_c0_g3_i1.p1  ORF type:complete len:416 (+),score=38.92 TRINITY_DN3639_c0_g3_i1:144-1250(+)